MSIRPIDIRRKEFKNGFRGYDANQVDDFLDAVADEFERIYSENSRVREEIASLRERLDQFEQLEGSIRSALVHAEQAAKDLRQNASREAELTIREAKARSHQILSDSSSRVERVQESYEALREAKQHFAHDFRQLLKHYLEVMDNADIASAKEIETSLRERLDLESVAAAREAAEARREESQRTVLGEEPEDSGREESGRPAASAGAAGGEQPAPTQRIETGESQGQEVEATEPEVEPSSVSRDVSAENTVAWQMPDELREEPGEEQTGTGAAAEVDREEPMPDERARTRDTGMDFFGDSGDAEGEEQDKSGGEENRKLFRASRFLRRRE